MRSLLFYLNLFWCVQAFVPRQHYHLQQKHHHASSRPNNKNALTSCDAMNSSGLWNAGMSYGKGPFRFYNNFQEWIKPFPLEDQQAYPEIFNIPEGVYEVVLRKPLGIVFADREDRTEDERGVYVVETVDGGNADRQGSLRSGDILLGVTAIKCIGAKWERRLIPALNFDFDTTVGAIGSNEPKWGCEDVVMMLYRPGVADMKAVDEFVEFFQPPSDSVWRL